MAIVAQRLLSQYSWPRSQWLRESTPQFSMLAITQTATKSKVNPSFPQTSNLPQILRAWVKSAQLILACLLWLGSLKPGITVNAGTISVIDAGFSPSASCHTLHPSVFKHDTLLSVRAEAIWNLWHTSCRNWYQSPLYPVVSCAATVNRGQKSLCRSSHVRSRKVYVIVTDTCICLYSGMWCVFSFIRCDIPIRGNAAAPGPFPLWGGQHITWAGGVRRGPRDRY